MISKERLDELTRNVEAYKKGPPHSWEVVTVSDVLELIATIRELTEGQPEPCPLDQTGDKGAVQVTEHAAWFRMAAGRLLSLGAGIGSANHDDPKYLRESLKWWVDREVEWYESVGRHFYHHGREDERNGNDRP